MATLDKDIIIRYALGELSPSEMKRVKREIEKDSAAQEELRIYQSSLGDLDQKFQEVRDEPIPENIAQRIEEVSRTIYKPRKKRFSLPTYFIGFASGGFAAVAAAFIGIAIIPAMLVTDKNELIIINFLIMFIFI